MDSNIPTPDPHGKAILHEARLCWESWSDFRTHRDRCKRYTYGRQWDDPVTIGGQTMTEEEFIRREGHLPLKNNLIRRLVRSVLGTWINYREDMEQAEADVVDTDSDGDLLGSKLQTSRERNSISELTVRAMEEFLISGLTVWRKSFGICADDSPDIITEAVCPGNFFIDVNSCDVRGNDAELVGELHDVPFGRLCASLAHTPTDYIRLSAIYSPELTADNFHDREETDSGSKAIPSFLRSSRRGLCRVIEVWRKERRPRYRCHDTRYGTIFRIEASQHTSLVVEENHRRLRNGLAAGLAERDIPLIHSHWIIDETWRYYFLSPQGHILTEGDTPFAHGHHPFVYKAYPFLDGEIHSFVGDVIDQQRHINRLITIFDWVMKASAKGVLLFPEEAMPKGWTLRDVADEWSRHNGVIMIRTKEGAPIPQQVNTNSINMGIVELLNVQMKMLEDISGVNSALQGKLSGNNVSGALYSYQTRNALASLLDIMESFHSFEKEATRTDISLLRQYSIHATDSFANTDIQGPDKERLHDSTLNFASENHKDSYDSYDS